MAFLAPRREAAICRRRALRSTLGIALLFTLLGGLSLGGLPGGAAGKAALGAAESGAIDQQAQLRGPPRAAGARTPAAIPDRDKGDGHDIAAHHRAWRDSLWALSARPSSLILDAAIPQPRPLHGRPQSPRAPPRYLIA